ACLTEIMIRLTKKLLFAIEAVLDIAYNGDPKNPVRSVEITEREGIPRRYLEPVLQELVREGILVGIRGPSGGYRLAREGRRLGADRQAAPASAEGHVRWIPASRRRGGPENSAAGCMTASSRRSARRRWSGCTGWRPRLASRPIFSPSASSSTRSPRSRIG